jgi:heme/copper-type cytochrome/quinol oxidase subunit 2
VVLSTAAALAADQATEVVASRQGFKPKVLNLRKGELARLRLTTADDEHCFAIDAFRVEKRIAPGRATLVDLTPDRVGTFPFYCCLEPDNAALQGRLVVSE